MFILRNIDKLEDFYQLLEDEYSRQLLTVLLKFRVLGPQHVKLPLNTKQYWDKRAYIDNSFLKEQRTITGTYPSDLNLYKLQGLCGPLEVHATSTSVLTIFLLEHYAYKKNARIIQIEPGDVIIDGGACWGDTALYFADRTGPEGKVYCFEFLQDNLEILQRNMSLNQHIADIIKVVPKALWDRSGEILSYRAFGPATSVIENKEQQGPQVSTLSIDDFVEEEKIAKIDYIKMDIEGSERKALQGAEKTIHTFKPKLAISLYHREDDLIAIPDYLNKLGLQYAFFLDHFTIHKEETVLFASPKAN
jgi:FkbM family methyltransferase